MGATVAVATVPGPFCEEQVNYAAELPYDMGAVYYEFGNAARGAEAQRYFAKAAESFAEAARIRPDYADAHNNLGDCLARQGRLEEAITCYRQAVALNPKLAKALANIGAVSRRLDRFDEAEQALRQALAINESMALAHYHLAVVLLRAGRGDEAAEHLAKTAELDADLAHRLWARCMLADAMAERGDGAGAVAAYRAVLAAAAKAPPATKARALKGAAWLLSVWPDPSVRKPDDAIQMASFAARIDQDSPDALDILAAAYAAAGRFDLAMSTADRALVAARRAGKVDMASEIQTRRGLYQAAQPCRRDKPYPFFTLP
jgi:tetratricopeptide (TPR) repeat protein